jgi:hypothetical protein
MSEFLFRNFQLLVCCGLRHQLSVTEISDPFCHSVVVQLAQVAFSLFWEKNSSVNFNLSCEDIQILFYRASSQNGLCRGLNLF